MADGSWGIDGAKRTGGGRLPLLVVLGAAALWVVLLQRTFYREDGLQLVYHFLLKGNRAHDIHPLYLPLCGTFADLLAFTGQGLFARAALFSCVAASLGLLLLAGLARRAGLGRDGAFFVAAVATCPAVGFFATVVEFHALHFGLACLCFLLAEGVARPDSGDRHRPRYGHALLLAVGTVLATHAHASGHLLVPLLMAWIAGRRGLRASLVDLVVLAAAHAALYELSRPLLLTSLGIELVGSQAVGLPQREAIQALLQRPSGIFARLGHVAVYEILLPYAFLWLAALMPLWRRTPRATLVLGLFGCLPYLGLCVAVLTDAAGVPFREWGCYLLPLAIPAAFCLVRAMGARPRLLAMLLAASLVVQVVTIRSHDGRPSRAWGEGLRAALDARQTWCLCGTEELSWALVEAPRVHPYHAVEALAQPAGADWLATTLTGLLGQGARVLVTRQAQGELGHPAFGAAGQALLARLRGGFVLQPVSSGSFVADELRAKP